MDTLIPCNDMTVDQAYIITLKDHELSEQLSARCRASCRQVGQPHTVWPAFDGTSGEIKIPESLQSQSWIKWIRQYDTDLSVTEVAAYFSHLSLWAHCVEINMPIVILEHDAVMVEPYLNHFGYNQIVYLGGREQMAGWKVTPIPPMALKNKHYRYILRAHAYAIDPHSAKNLLAHTIKHGINESLDVTIRTDIFGVIQVGFYAYDLPSSVTTITGKK